MNQELIGFFFQDGDTIYTASTDKTVGVFDTMTGINYKYCQVASNVCK